MPSKTSLWCFQFSSKYSISSIDFLLILSFINGILRQPSSNSQRSPSSFKTLGFTKTFLKPDIFGSFKVVPSTTKTLNGFPICGAAKPIPSANFIVSNMSLESLLISISSLLITKAFFFNIELPYIYIGYIIFYYLLNKIVKLKKH